MPTFAVLYTYDDRAEQRAEVRPEHRAFLRGMLDAGALLASGPFTGAPDRGDAPDGALLLVRAADAEAAREALSEDPFVARGLVADMSVRGWEPVLGPWAG